MDTLSEIYDCLPEDILFTSGATEANNLAIFSGIKLAKRENPTANIILTSYLEHKSVLEPLKVIAQRENLEVVYVDITQEGFIDLADFEQKVASNQVLWASVCMTNGEIGTNQPISKIATMCQGHGIMLHVDGSQAGYCDIQFGELPFGF